MNKKTIIIIALLAVIILGAVIVKSTMKAGCDKSCDQTWLPLNKELPSPIRIMPVRCYDNNHQEDFSAEGGIELTLDGKYNTIWHSAYTPELLKVTPETPADLVYEFEGVDRIDRMIYVPRTDGGINGTITQAEVYVKTQQDKDERMVGHFEWTADSTPKYIVFNGGLQQPLSVRMHVLSGHGGWGSCAEMQFLKDSALIQSSSLFADELCTKLKDGVTSEDIKNEKTPVFRELASQLKDGTYRTDYRVASYECYNSPSYLAEQWKTPGQCYDQMQGVTGIMMEPGKHLVMASNIQDSLKVYLKVVAWYTGKIGIKFDGGRPEIQVFPLQNGANIIDFESEWNGLAYIAYFSEGHAEECPPINIHFVGGTINGYLSPDMTNEQMHKMTAEAPSQFMDLVSKKVHAVWTAEGMHNYCKADDGKSLGYRQYMNILDSLMTWQQRVVGFEKYGYAPKNRTLLHVNFDYSPAYQWALGVSVHVENESNQLNCRSLVYDNSECIWGLGHEWGHQHQLKPYFNWDGINEVSNNLNTYYCVMHMGYRYEQIDEDKRAEMEKSIEHYLNDKTDDCLFEIEAPYDNAFGRLAPFLKLCNYFANEGGKPDFLPDLYEAFRHADMPKTTNVVPYVMNFIRTTSVISGYNLLPYFERFGFLRIKDFELVDYEASHYQLTQEQLDAFRNEMDDLAQNENLKTMPDGMIESIAHTPDIEYEHPAFEN